MDVVVVGLIVVVVITDVVVVGCIEVVDIVAGTTSQEPRSLGEQLKFQ